MTLDDELRERQFAWPGPAVAAGRDRVSGDIPGRAIVC
jgi:hypothetical protein